MNKMKRLLYILLFLVPLIAQGQDPVIHVMGDANTLQWAKGYLRVDKGVKFTNLATTDTNVVLGLDAFGNLVKRYKRVGGGDVTSVNGQVGDVVLRTTNIPEGTNLYFTNVRADARVAAALINYYTKGQIDSTLALFLTLASAQATYVPLTRTLTINGTAYDLSANRTWTVTGTTAIYNKWGNIIFGMDSVATDTSLVTTRLRAKKIGDSVAALIPTNNNQLTNGAGYITTFTELDPLSYHYADTNTYKKPASFNYVKDNYYLASNPNSWIGLGAISATAPVAYNNSTGVISMAQASGSVSGYLSNTDWTTFNNKQASGTYISYILSGFAITATGTTSVTVGVDTALVATRLRVQKAVDSLNAVMSAMLAQTTTAASYTGTLTPTSTSGNIASTVSYIITAQAGALQFNPPTGTWVNGQILIIRILDNGTARALTYSTATGGYRAGTTVTPPSTTTVNKTLYLEYMYNSTANKFDLIGYADGY